MVTLKIMQVTKELVNLFVTELGDDLVNCIQEKITDKLQDCLVRDPPGVTNYNRESYDIYNTTVAIGFDFDTIADFIVEHTSFSVNSDKKDEGVIPEHLRREQERLWLLRSQK